MARRAMYKWGVALRKESVDRNILSNSAMVTSLLMSLSARRAWIEMMQFVPITTSDVSLSARRAWIEIPNRIYFCAIC